MLDAVSFIFVSHIHHSFAETSKSDKDLIRLKWRDVHPSLADQQRRFDFIQEKSRRILNISLRKLPWRSTHTTLSFLCPASPEGITIFQQRTIHAGETAEADVHNSSFEPFGLYD